MERIEIHPDGCNGQTVVRGTRITVQTILEYLEGGDSVQEILSGYPRLKRGRCSGLFGLCSQIV
jgi:uncharacterized protein (DUF433 family)